MISMFYYFFLVGYSALFASGFDDSWALRQLTAPGLSQEWGWIHLQKTAMDSMGRSENRNCF